MSLEEEIAINQFGQGIYSDELLVNFSQLDEQEQRNRFVRFYCQVCELALGDSDVQQALAECSLTATDPIYAYLNLDRLITGTKNVLWIPPTVNPPEGKLDTPYTLLLHLFRIDYQRRFALEKGNPANWWYWDLSNPEIVQSILTRHQALVEEVYTNPSFRSEFISLAKLWHEPMNLEQAMHQEPAPKPQTHFDFLTYDEMTTASIKLFDDKIGRSIGVLRHSLEKAFSVRYGLPAEQARRLVLDVLERHVREKYNTGLF